MTDRRANETVINVIPSEYICEAMCVGKSFAKVIPKRRSMCGLPQILRLPGTGGPKKKHKLLADIMKIVKSQLGRHSAVPTSVQAST